MGKQGLSVHIREPLATAGSALRPLWTGVHFLQDWKSQAAFPIGSVPRLVAHTCLCYNEGPEARLLPTTMYEASEER
jgi:hypothetical protein